MMKARVEEVAGEDDRLPTTPRTDTAAETTHSGFARVRPGVEGKSTSSRGEGEGDGERNRTLDDASRRRHTVFGDKTGREKEKLSITQWRDLLREATGLGLRVERVDWLLQLDARLQRCQKQLELVAANELKLPTVQSLHALVRCRKRVCMRN